MSRTISLPPLNAVRAWERFEQLARFTRPDVPWTRRAFSPLFVEARAWLCRQFEAAGLSVSLDAGGNLVGRRPGCDPLLRPIITGSHCDTVVGGGRFDGILGVLAAIEVAQTLDEHGVQLAHALEVIDFLSEEPSDYGISCVGSRAFSGVLSPEMLASRSDTGETLAAAMTRIGAQPAQLSQPLRPAGSTAAFVELHIEQGPVLEARRLPIGVVTSIVGIRRMRITVDGQPDHAGTTPMDIRRDALVGAARYIDHVHWRASQLSGRPHYVVATTGRIRVTPNVPNAVPGFVELVMEVRSDDDDVLEQFPQAVIDTVRDDLTGLHLQIDMTELSRARPTSCSPIVMDAVEHAASSLGYPSMRMPSGAGHDAVYVAPTGPIGMIFVPCLNGRSHCPEESITPEQMLDGARVLYRTIVDLDRRLRAPFD